MARRIRFARKEQVVGRFAAAAPPITIAEIQAKLDEYLTNEGKNSGLEIGFNWKLSAWEAIDDVFPFDAFFPPEKFLRDVDRSDVAAFIAAASIITGAVRAKWGRRGGKLVSLLNGIDESLEDLEPFT